MNQDELKQFGDLAKKYERGKDKDAVKKIFSEDMHEVFQEVNDAGHSAATLKAEEKYKPIVEQTEAFKQRAEAAEAKLKAFDDKAPDVATVRKTYEDAEKRLREEYDNRIKTMETQHATALQDAQAKLIDERLKVAKKNLVKKLADSKIGVDEEYAETILVERADVKDRIKVEADGSVKVLKKDSKDMYIVPAEGREALDHLAEELGETVQDRWKTSGGGRGSGTRGSEGGSTGALSERFENTRKRIQESEKAARDQRGAGSAAERLGSRR